MRSQHRHVARPQAIDGVPIGVEAQEPALRRHVDPVAQGQLQRAGRLVELVQAQIGHRDKLDGPASACAGGPLGAGVVPEDQSARRHGIGHRTAAPAAAADQSQLNGVVRCGVDVRDSHARQRRRGGKLAGGLDEFPTRRKSLLAALHMRHAGWNGDPVSSSNRCEDGMGE